MVLRYLIFHRTEEFLDRLYHKRCPQHQSMVRHADQWKKLGKNRKMNQLIYC